MRWYNINNKDFNLLYLSRKDEINSNNGWLMSLNIKIRIDNVLLRKFLELVIFDLFIVFFTFISNYDFSMKIFHRFWKLLFF